MSFILDALKKSELDRQRQNSPGLVESSLVRPRAGLPLWAIGLLVLLAINLVVLLFVLVRGALAPTATTTPSPAATPEQLLGGPRSIRCRSTIRAFQSARFGTDVCTGDSG